jgi:hypothetical protein
MSQPPIGPGTPPPGGPPVPCVEAPLPTTLESAVAEVKRLRVLQAESDDLIALMRVQLKGKV